MTLRHIVTWKLASESAEERAEQAARITRELRGLVGVVPTIQTLSVGADVVGGGNWDLALVADFADADALDAYQTHPAHQAIVGYVRSVVSSRSAVDFEL
ncbi:Dabb family protein [Microbacterium sp. NPDC089189]|uniref:Dabb family protein n=1 Tax=Microbacterium sp. NPDC089189 TaxID=3154972 RepID=UPI00342068BF